MKISELSQETGISQRMLRYFEELGLIHPRRADSDYRIYSLEDKKKVIEIKTLQSMGFTLKEVLQLFQSPSQTSEIFDQVYRREQEAMIEKKISLRDLKERFLKKWTHPFSQRTAYRIPNMDQLLDEMKEEGWLIHSTDYIQFGEWRKMNKDRSFAAGEMIWQSSLYLISDHNQQSDMNNLSEDNFAEKNIALKTFVDMSYKFSKTFFRCAHKAWKTLDGHPPRGIPREDAMTIFAENEIIVELIFFKQEKYAADAKTPNPKNQLQLILPYRAIYSLAKATEDHRAPRSS